MPWTLSDDEFDGDQGPDRIGNADQGGDADQSGEEGGEADIVIPPGKKARQQKARKRQHGAQIFTPMKREAPRASTNADRAANARSAKKTRRMQKTEPPSETSHCSFLVPFVGAAALCCSLLKSDKPVEVSALGEAILSLLDHYCSPAPSALSPTLEARFLGKAERTQSRARLAIGALQHECNRLFWGSFFSWLYKEIKSGVYRAVSCLLYMVYDETRLAIRKEDTPGAANPSTSSTQVVEHGKVPIDVSRLQGRFKRTGKVHAKILQAAVTVAFIVWDTRAMQAILLQCDIATHLGQCDRCTAETTWHFLSLLLAIPMLMEAVALFPFCCRANTADRAGSNERLNQGLRTSYPEDAHLQLPCDQHITQTAISNGIKIQRSDVSKVVHFTLQTSEANGAEEFFECLVQSIAAKLDLQPQEKPLPSDHPGIQHRDVFFRFRASSRRVASE